MRGARLNRIFVSIVLQTALIISLLSGCGSKTPEPVDDVQNNDGLSSEEASDIDYVLSGGKGTVIRIAGWYQDEYIGNLKSFLTKQFPDVTFEYVYINKNHYTAIIDTQLSYKGAPDIILVNQDMAKKHAYTGYISPLTDICEGFTAEAKKAFGYGGDIYAVPSTTSFECVYYNENLFKKYGIDEPDSNEEFLSLCDFIKKALNKKPMSAGLKDYEAVSSSAQAFLQAYYFGTEEGRSFGNRIQSESIGLYSDFYSHLTGWEKLVEHGIFTPDMTMMDKKAAISEFASEESFMLIGGPEDYSKIKTANPELELGTFSLCRDAEGRQLLIGGCSCGYAINASSKNIDAAKEILAVLATEEGQNAIWRDRVGSRSYLEGVVFTNPKAFYGIKEAFDEGNLYLPYTEWGAQNQEINRIFGKKLQEVVSGQKTLSVALMQAAVQINEIKNNK